MVGEEDDGGGCKVELIVTVSWTLCIYVVDVVNIAAGRALFTSDKT